MVDEQTETNLRQAETSAKREFDRYLVLNKISTRAGQENVSTPTPESECVDPSNLAIRSGLA